MSKIPQNIEKVSINWKPDKIDKVPIYKQIINYINDKIAKGDWIVGAKLPSQRKMAQSFGVNRSTIVTAMEELLSYGVIESDFGGGTKVASNTWSLIMSSTPDWNEYMKAGSFKANVPTIQKINKLEFEDKYIRMGTGELAPELFPTTMIKKVLQKLPERIVSLNYLEPLGLQELRKCLSERLEKEGISASPKEILICSGSLQGLQLISASMIKKGDSLFTEAPSYLKSLQIFQSSGADFIGVDMDREGMMPWTITKPAQNAFIYTIPTFQNPTGKVMTAERRKELYNFCSINRLPVIEDDAYGKLWFNEEPPKPIKTMDKNGMILYLGTVSKTMAPGLRIGWLVGPESVTERLGDVKMQVDYGASSVSQWALTELMTSGKYDEYLIWLRKELKIRCESGLAAVKKYFYGLATWEAPQGGFYIWLRINKKINAEKLFNEALNKNILINPGSIYDFKENNSIRLSYAYASIEEFEVGIKILAGTIENL